MTDWRNWAPLGLLILVLCLLPRAYPQQTSTNILPSPAPWANSRIPPGSDPLMGSLNEQMAAERNFARQTKIVDQSAELLVLAKKLKADIAQSQSDQITAAVLKEAAEIEKLAKSIKNKMRNGY